MPVTRFRDVGAVAFIAGGEAGGASISMGCVNSLSLALGSDVLRAACSYAISERYQGLTNLNLEVTIEAADPFLDVHPGDKGPLSFFIPGAGSATGLPGDGLSVDIESVMCTGHSGRAEKDSLASGTYTFRAENISTPASPAAPMTITAGSPIGVSAGGPTSFIRDIGGFTFAPSGSGSGITADVFCPRSFEFNEQGTLIEDGCQGTLWAEYVGISALNTTATVTGRGLLPALGEGSGITLGTKGTVSFSVITGSDESCTATEAGGSASMARANINAINITATAGQLAEASLSWTGHGEAGELTDRTKRAIISFSS